MKKISKWVAVSLALSMTFSPIAANAAYTTATAPAIKTTAATIVTTAQPALVDSGKIAPKPSNDRTPPGHGGTIPGTGTATPNNGGTPPGHDETKSPRVSEAMNADNITITNNPIDLSDVIHASGLLAGDVVNVYNAATGGDILATQTVAQDATDVTLYVPQLGAEAGNVYISVTSIDKRESPRVEKAFGVQLVRTDAPALNQITVTNNPVELSDRIKVTGLSEGDMVNVYRDAIGKDLLAAGTVAAGATELTLSPAEIGTEAGSLYVTITSTGELESYRTEKTYTQALSRLFDAQLLSMNDLHGKIDQVYTSGSNSIGRMDYVASYIKAREATNPENTLLVHAGDMVGGSSPVSALFQDEPTVEIMEHLGFDVGTIGNHEFDEGVNEMLRLNNGGDHPKGTMNYDGIDFPMLAANVIWKSTGQRVLDAYAIKEVGGVKVGFIGVTTRETLNMVIPEGIKDITITAETPAVNAAVEELKAQGVKAIVVLSHMAATQSGDSATDAAAEMAKTVDPEVDIIFAAHNHQKVNGVVNNKLIVQAWEYGKAIGDVDLVIDRVTGDIVSKKAEIVEIVQAGVTPDPAVAGILSKYATQIQDILNREIGQASEDITSKSAGGGLSNLVADSMKWSMKSDFAMINGSGMRGTITAGPVTWGTLYNVLPFSNVLTRLEITGADLETILNNQISSSGPDFGIAGFKYVYDSMSGKVASMTLPNGDPIIKTQVYTLTVNNYMATSTGSKYVKIGELGKNVVIGSQLGYDDDLAGLVDYVKVEYADKNRPLTNLKDGRISKLQITDIGQVTIAALRAAGTSKKATIEGVVTSAPGSYGYKGFYVQDATGGVYVYTNNDLGVAVGDKVKLTGTTGEYSGEFQLMDAPVLVSKTAGTVPAPVVVTPASVGKANEGQLVKLEKVVISNLRASGVSGSYQFIATKNGESVQVYFDNRIGTDYNTFLANFNNGDEVHVYGVSSQFGGVVQVKPTKPTAIEPANPTDAQLVALDSSDVAITFASGDSATSVKGNLNLPTVGTRGAEIAWTSDDESVVSTAGVVQRPAFDAGDKTVTLTATIRKNDATVQKQFTVTVIKMPASDDATLTSGVYTIDNTLGTINNVTYGTTVETLKSNVKIPTGASFKVYNGLTEVLTGTVKDGYTVTVVAADGQTTKNYTIKVLSFVANHVVISEIYPTGGNASSVYKNDFVELYNPTDQPISLAGWSLQYAGSTSLYSNTNTVALTKTIPAHGYYLVQLQAGTSTTSQGLALPAADDQTTSINLAGAGGKVALVRSTTLITGKNDANVVDFVGWGSANDFKGEAAQAPTVDNRSSLERKANDGSSPVTGAGATLGNGYNTNNNKADFVVRNGVGPQNTSSTPE